MSIRSRWIGGSVLATLLVGLLAMPEADAKGPKGGPRAARAPRVSAARRPSRPQPHPAKMPRASVPARANVARANNALARKNNAQVHAKNIQPRANNANARVNSATSTGSVNPARVAQANSIGATSTRSPYSYTYGSGSHARHYRAYGYGRGYRNRYNRGGSGYGRSQGNTRAIVSRLRSVHSGLARLDHDYRGHRVRAMHSISMAIRQLSHRSMIYRNTGFASNMNNNRGQGNNRQAGLNGNGNGNARRPQPLTQAQSDSRMGQHLRTLQGVHMQLTGQGTNTSGHSRARGHVQVAIRELNTALSIR